MNDHPLVISLFRNRYDTDPRPATATWVELAAKLSEHKTRPAKDRELWSPTYYAPGTTRAKVNVIQLSCLVLDFDDGTTPEEYTEAWSGYAHVIHSTYSHTPEAPRWRAVFPLSRTLWAADWDAAWHRLTAGLAPGKFDASCKDASRMYYLPAHPPRDEAHFAVAHEGAFLEPEAFAETVPPPAPRLPAPPLAPLPPSPPRAPGDRVPAERLVEWALRRIVLEKHPEHGQGRHCGTFWLLCQLRDNGYDSEEGSHICREHWLHRLPPTDPAGKPSAYTEEEFAACWLSVYSEPARAPWPLPEPIPDPPEDLAPPERRTPGNDPVVIADDFEAALETDSPTATAAVVSPPPAGLPQAVAPILTIPVRARREGEPGHDFAGLYNLAGLQNSPCAAPPFIVDELIPVGCTELFGHAKAGKTMAALGIATPVALGGIALSRFQCQQGEVLYIAAEDAPWRMKDRTSHLLVDIRDWPAGFWITHEWGMRMTSQGFAKLEDWLDARRDTRMVVLDPWHAMRIPYPRGADIVSLDYEAFKRLNLLGTQAGCSILVIHHASKRGGEESINNASGSHGIGAGAGTILEFKRIREQHTAQLVVSGRDAKNECTWSLERDTRTGHWACVGDAGELQANENRMAVWECLQGGGHMRPKAIADATGIALPTIYSLCARMLKAGELHGGNGGYSAGRKPGRREELV